ncbi:MAG TPA: hypothetical protein VHK69_14605, partial [Chitinophagaceae bacterium]|nr:hypothetical protein [Chitinophagaceae bacterium]
EPHFLFLPSTVFLLGAVRGALGLTAVVGTAGFRCARGSAIAAARFCIFLLGLVLLPASYIFTHNLSIWDTATKKVPK